MLRDKNTFFYNLPHDKSLILREKDVVGREEKLSAKKKQLLARIALCKKQLENGSERLADNVIFVCKNNLAKYERQLANLQTKSSHKIHRSYTKLDNKKIKSYVLLWIDDAKKHGDIYVRAEDIAYQLNVKPHFVKQVLQELNVEGVLSQAINRAAHDSPRDPWGFAGTSLWSSSIYRILYEENNED